MGNSTSLLCIVRLGFVSTRHFQHWFEGYNFTLQNLSIATLIPLSCLHHYHHHHHHHHHKQVARSPYQTPAPKYTDMRKSFRPHSNNCIIDQDRLQQLELSRELDDWPIPSIETEQHYHQQQQPAMANRAGTAEEEAERTNRKLEDQLLSLNTCHGTDLSMRELETCISLVDYRLSTTTSTADVLDAFHDCPPSELAGWKGMNVSWSIWVEDDASREEFEAAVEDDARDVLTLINERAGTDISMEALELVVSLMNYIYGSGVGVLDVLRLRNRRFEEPMDFSSGSRVGDEELVGAFKALDLRVGLKNAVDDLGDVFSEAKF